MNPYVRSGVSNSKRKDKSSASVTVDFHFDHDFANLDSQKSQLTLDFLKFLCYQKGQIPVQFNQLVNHLNFTEKEIVNDARLQGIGMVSHVLQFCSLNH